MTLFMETTQIAPEKTIAEITTALVKAGATQIFTEYEPTTQQVAAVCFMLVVQNAPLRFRLPCRWPSIAKLLASRTRDYQHWIGCLKSSPGYEGYLKNLKIIEGRYADQARRVGWRQILRWVQAQLALVETNMVKTEEVFMPYLQLQNGQTVFEMIEQKGVALLTGPAR
jgi:hypothetical protein